MMTIEQCRGARGLLGWTQQDLADASGLSKTAINNFEKGHSDIKSESLRAIRMAFESADVEFLGQDGLRKKTETTRIFKGSSATGELLQDIEDTLKVSTGGELLIAHVDNRISSRISTQILFNHIEFLKRNKIQERVLCAEGTKNVLSPHDECRWLPKDKIAAGIPTFIYGTKVAFELWDQAMIVVINSAEAQAAERRRFEYLWAKAEIPMAQGQNGAPVQAQAGSKGL
jgi:transcriptional regulator with XRE-family HTH domain